MEEVLRKGRGWRKGSNGKWKRKGKKNGCRRQVCEKEDGEEMRFSLIFHGSYTLWIFIWAGREWACEACFIWPLTDYLFVNISHHFSFSKPRGGLRILTSTPKDPKLSAEPLPLLPGLILHLQAGWGPKLWEYLRIDPTHKSGVSVTGHLLYNLQGIASDLGCWQ